MRSLLEEYERYSNGKVKVEYVDPLRQPNKAREIANIYGIEFKKNLVIIDAREDTEKRSRRLKAPRRTPPTCASCPETPSWCTPPARTARA